MNISQLTKLAAATLDPKIKAGTVKSKELQAVLQSLVATPGDELVELLLNDRDTYREAWKTANDTSQKLWAEILLMQQNAKIAETASQQKELQDQLNDRELRIRILKEQLQAEQVSKARAEEASEQYHAYGERMKDKATDAEKRLGHVTANNHALQREIQTVHNKFYPATPKQVTDANVNELLKWIGLYGEQTQKTLDLRSEQLEAHRISSTSQQVWQSEAMERLVEMHNLLWPNQPANGKSTGEMVDIAAAIKAGIDHNLESMKALDATVKELNAADADSQWRKYVEPHIISEYNRVLADDTKSIVTDKAVSPGTLTGMVSALAERAIRGRGLEKAQRKVEDLERVIEKAHKQVFDRPTDNNRMRQHAEAVEALASAADDAKLEADDKLCKLRNQISEEYRSIWPEGTCTEDGMARLYALRNGVVQFRNDYNRTLGLLELETETSKMHLQKVTDLERVKRELHEKIAETYNKLCKGGSSTAPMEQLLAIRVNAMSRTEVSENLRKQLDELQKPELFAVGRTVYLKEALGVGQAVIEKGTALRIRATNHRGPEKKLVAVDGLNVWLHEDLLQQTKD